MTDFLVALYKMALSDRAKASPEKAAARYGIPVAWCRWYIQDANRSGDHWPVRG